MKVEIIKMELKDYKAGDVLSVYDAYEGEEKTYLLYLDNIECNIGAIDLSNGQVSHCFALDGATFDDVIGRCLHEANATEYKVFSNSETKLILGGSDN